jgi:hypothetical protein
MSHLILIAAAAAVCYPLFLLISGTRRCPACEGRKVVANRTGFQPCRRCQATGRASRRGALFMHRLVHDHAWPWERERISDAAERRMGDEP